jgi:hypothetical protein
MQDKQPWRASAPRADSRLDLRHVRAECRATQRAPFLSSESVGQNSGSVVRCVQPDGAATARMAQATSSKGGRSCAKHSRATGE